MATEADYRLPRTVRPSRYELTLEPDLVSGAFQGREVVDVQVLEAVDEIVLNAADLEIDTAELIPADGGEPIPARTELDGESERLVVHLERVADPGAWKLVVGFRGALSANLVGFYRSTYTNAAGEEQTIATTQFEATDARRAFPCWDEPDLKATFAVTLVVPAGLTTVSNTREVAAEPTGDGRVRHRFAETMVMSTYLVAFVIGELDVTDPVDVDGIPLRVVHAPGKGGLTDFALEMAEFTLRYFADYYRIPYPGDKLDLIGIPDFAWGAMENLGAVTFRETALLVDREKATRKELAASPRSSPTSSPTCGSATW
jgi:puromycin-sensitive aminopeptidase